MKQEYYIPLAIIIGAIIITAGIYFTGTFKYRKALESCKYEFLTDGSADSEKLEEALMKKFMLPICALGRINEYENKF